MKPSAAKAVYLSMACTLLAGCSETGFQGMFGAGKYSPDETQVSQNQSLSVPPDLQLRPPSNDAVPPPPQPPARTAYVPPQQPLTMQPSDEEPAPANAGQQQTYQQQTYTPPAQQAYTPPPAQQPQDVYARLGISKVNADGSQKSQGQLNEELRRKKIEAEQQKNPNYGTIWNMGNVWSDSQ